MQRSSLTVINDFFKGITLTFCKQAIELNVCYHNNGLRINYLNSNSCIYITKNGNLKKFLIEKKTSCN